MENGMQRCFIVVTIILCLFINFYAIAGNGYGALVGKTTFTSPFDSQNHSMRYAGPKKNGIVFIERSILTPQYLKVKNLRGRVIWIGSSCQIEEKKNRLEETVKSDQSTENENGDQNVKECPEIRPEVCTQDYRPVCAELENGDMKTYSNGCNACADPAVIGYRDGACE
jgi:hypothetical protein